MNFDKHLFISYSHLDNQPLLPETEGWITRFHESLDAFLSMRMGAKAKIWRDERLQGNDIFVNEIVDQFPHTALLVSVLTPRYLNSEWCLREVNEFCHVAEESGGISIGNKSRVFKVIKTPVDQTTALPPILENALGYEFYTDADGAPLELDPQENPQDYKRRINKLAWDVTQLLKQLQVDTSEQPSDIDTTKPTIYLAECSYDRKRDREILEADLKRHGYRILPNHPLPRDEEAYVQTVSELLTHCQLAIHLVGDHYGAVPDGPTIESVVVHQNQLAVQHSQQHGLQRIIWLPDGTHSTQDLQEAFIQTLHNSAAAQFGADLITGDLEALKTTIHTTLKQLETPKSAAIPLTPATVDAPKLIYLICTQKDRKATVPLRKWLRQQGLEVELPAFEGNATEVRAANQQLLTNCDAVLVFYGAGDEAWKRTIDSDLQKMAGVRNGKPLLARYIYLAAPTTMDKEDLIDLEEPDLIDGLDGFVAEPLTPFMQAVQPEGDQA